MRQTVPTVTSRRGNTRVIIQTWTFAINKFIVFYAMYIVLTAHTTRVPAHSVTPRDCCHTWNNFHNGVPTHGLPSRAPARLRNRPGASVVHSHLDSLRLEWMPFPSLASFCERLRDRPPKQATRAHMFSLQRFWPDWACRHLQAEFCRHTSSLVRTDSRLPDAPPALPAPCRLRPCRPAPEDNPPTERLERSGCRQPDPMTNSYTCTTGFCRSSPLLWHYTTNNFSSEKSRNWQKNY